MLESQVSSFFSGHTSQDETDKEAGVSVFSPILSAMSEAKVNTQVFYFPGSQQLTLNKLLLFNQVEHLNHPPGSNWHPSRTNVWI